jgi:CubicO group peptidase (beta-lactamase class C family)
MLVSIILKSERMRMHQGRRSVLGLAVLGALHPLLAAAERGHGELERALMAIVADQACELASLSVLAIRNGDVSYQGQFGRRHIAPDRPVERDTLFRIASVSKLMTTLGLMRLLEDGKVALDVDVSRYLGFRLRNPHFPERPISLRSLLTHTASLRDDGGYSWTADIALKDVIGPAMWSAQAGPGDYFSYCNLGWGLIGTIMEAVTGERFDRLMQRLLLAPLGLEGGYDPSALAVPHIATLYRKRALDTDTWDAAGPWIAQADDVDQQPPAPPSGLARYVIGANATPFSPTGGLRISAHGLGVIMRMLMHDGMHQGRRLLRSATLDRMFSRAWTDDGKNGDTMNGFYQCWGLGNQQFPDQTGTSTRLVEGGGFAAVGHLGDAYGLISAFVMDRKRRNGIIMLVGGTATDPLAAAGKGVYSAMPRFQERIMTVLYRRAILVQT